MREVRTTYYRPIGCIELDNVSVAGTAAWIWYARELLTQHDASIFVPRKGEPKLGFSWRQYYQIHTLNRSKTTACVQCEISCAQNGLLRRLDAACARVPIFGKKHESNHTWSPACTRASLLIPGAAIHK